MLVQMEIDLKDQITQKFNTLSQEDHSNDPDFLRQLRSKAFEAFGQLGFPTVKNEEWKYTPVQSLLKDNYLFNAERFLSDSNGHYKEYQYFGKGLDAYTIVLLNGEIQMSLSQLPDPNEVTILPVYHGIQAKSETLKNAERHYTNNPFLALNTALFDGGVFVEIHKNTILDRPIHIVHLAHSTTAYFKNSKNIIVAHQGSESEIIESVENLNTEQFVLRNAATSISVASNAKLNHYKLQKGSDQIRLVEHTEVDQAADSQYANYTFTLPGYRFVRNNLFLSLSGSNIESHMYGLYLTNDHQLVDNHTLVDHQYPHCESNQLYKGIMMDHSKAVFNGKVYVHPIAQKTNAFQQNNNILFSDAASIYSKPQLEIFADDVKCSHGSTIGQLDPEALFYLKSRGIDEEDGRSMLVNAFAFDVTEKIENDEIKKLLNTAISETMLGAPELV